MNFPSMPDIVPIGKSGNAEILHYSISEDEAKIGNFRAAIHGDYDAIVNPGRYAMLKVDGGLMMTDTDMEKRTNREFLVRAKGSVLVAGLGLGMILHPLAEKLSVTDITVIEKSPGVAELVHATVPNKVTVIVDDIFTWRPAKGTKYDTIYFDIWPTLCTDNLEEIQKLKRAFRSRLAPGGVMLAWVEQKLKWRKRHGF